MHKWSIVGVVPEGNPIDIQGINPWDFQWRRMKDELIELPDPMYLAQLHRMWIYEVSTPEKVINFAAGEVSANMWMFYIPMTGFSRRFAGRPS